MKKSIILLLFGLMFNPLSAEIITCKKLTEILPQIDQETLVVFNINNVLTVSRQDAGSTPWAEEQIASIMQKKKTSKPHATNLFIPLWHAILIASDVELYDPEAEAIVFHLQQKGIKVMALTNRYTEMAYPTHKNLRSVGIDFAKNPPYSEDTWIMGLASPAKFVEGILFNGLINFKGDTLAAFLQQIQCRPSKVIYVEDKPKHLEQVGEKIAALGIPFLGVHFGALELEREAYRPELAAIQVKYHQDILDDASALILRHGQTGCKKAMEIEVSAQRPNKQHFKTILSLDNLKPDLQPGTLVITELDQVLWKTKGSIGSRPFLQHMVDKYMTLGDCPRSARERADRLFETIQRRAQVHLLVDIDFFKQIPKRNCWSIAVTYRPKTLLQRTHEQAESVGLQFHSPFKGESHLPNGFQCREEALTQFQALEEKLGKLAVKPSQVLAISSDPEDLVQLEKVANSCKIPFQGRLFSPPCQDVLLDDEVLMIELKYLDTLLSNPEASQLFKFAQ